MKLVIGKLRESKMVGEYSTSYEEYEFGKEEVVATVERKVIDNITASNIETVIVNSFEGGSNYWLEIDTDNKEAVWKDKPTGVPYSTWATQMLLEGKTLHLEDAEDESEKFTLNLEQLVKGFQLNNEKRPFDCDVEDGDATTSDCILQYGIFGKLIYG